METMSNSDKHVLTVNAGSSSIKIAAFTLGEEPHKLFEATIENIGQDTAKFIADGEVKQIATSNHSEAATILLQELTNQISASHITTVGHRIVHGGPKYYQTQRVTDELIADLQQLTAFDPEHLPNELALIETFNDLLPDAQQLVSFDTAFHHDLPTRSRLLPIPRRFESEGIRRYGFHGLSYAYILDELRRVEGEAAANGKVIIAHLGSGVSLVALEGGQPIDTTMSMTPASGVPMSTRSGDIDPGLALYLARVQGMDADQFTKMTNFESGLLGISETTADMKQLLQNESTDERAKDAVEIFCYNLKKSIGGLSAALGGLHTLVFTGGMGENAPLIRARVCESLEFIGIHLDTGRNQENARLISADGSPVGVHVIHTDEAVTIAREISKAIDQ